MLTSQKAYIQGTTARGAAYDHAFKVNLPITGEYSIDGGPSETGSGNVELIVFNSTKLVLPKNNINYNFGANTDPAITCLSAPAVAEFNIVIKGTLGSYSSEFVSKSYIDPFITVYPSGTVGDESQGKYDLHIWELTGTDTWVKNGETLPIAVLIPEDWKWPLEKKNIKTVYANFSPIDSWDPAWASGGPTDPTLVFDVAPCP